MIFESLTNNLKYKEFRERCMSNEDVDGFFEWVGKRREDYHQPPLYLSVDSNSLPSGSVRYLTELRMAKVALEKGCEFVTNLDHCGYDGINLIIKGSGWVPLKKKRGGLSEKRKVR